MGFVHGSFKPASFGLLARVPRRGVRSVPTAGELQDEEMENSTWSVPSELMFNVWENEDFVFSLFPYVAYIMHGGT